SVLFVFFSSRRRHTMFSRDWSSDVCSSELAQLLGRGLGVLVVTLELVGGVAGDDLADRLLRVEHHAVLVELGRRADLAVLVDDRSEERRVRRACGAWRAASQVAPRSRSCSG